MTELSVVDIEQRIAEIETDRSATAAAVAGDTPLRAALEQRRGEPYADHEWSEATRNLAAFMMIALEWKRDRDERTTR